MAEKRRPGRPRGKRSDRNYTQVCGYVRLDTYKAVRKLLIDEDLEFSELLQSLLESWILLKQNEICDD